MPDYKGPAQSPNWETALRLPFIPEGQGYHLEFKKHDRFPGFPWFKEDRGLLYFEVITIWGERLEAGIDDSREFMAEGLEWIPRRPVRGRRRIRREHVVAWRRLDT